MSQMQSLLIKTGTILGLFLFLGFFNQSQAQVKHTLDKIVAKVGDELILYSDIENQKLNMLQNGMDLPDKIDCLILEELLYEKLLIHQAQVDSIEVGDEIVNQEMESRINVIAQQIGGIKKLEEFYGKSVAQIKGEFFEIIKKRMQAERMKDEITAGVDVTPKEVKAFFNTYNKDSIPYINARITIAQIVLYPQLTEKDKELALKEITESRARVINKEIPFDLEALKVSKDPGSKSLGGDLGWQSRGTMVPEFEAELFKLQTGEISPVFETQYGYHYLQLMDRKGDNYHVRHILINPESDKSAIIRIKTRVDSIYNAVKAGAITFREAAAQFSNDEDSKNNGGLIMNPYTGEYTWDLSNINDIDPQMSRIVDKLNVGGMTQPILYDNFYEQKQGVRIVMLLSKSKPHQANLSDDYQLIQMAALNSKKQEIIDAWVKDKIASNYIWIEEKYATSCAFRNTWILKGGS